jgi:hypothetical protein
MKLAIFFSGRIKGYEHCLQHLLMYKEHYDTTYFCSLNQKEIDPYTEKFFSELDIKEDQQIFEETQYPDWLVHFNFKKMTIHGVYTIRDNRFKVYSMFYHRRKAFELIYNYQNKYNEKFDIFLQYRADLISDTFIHLEVPLKNTIYLLDNKNTGADIFCKITDIISYGDFDSMNKVTKLVNHIEVICNNNVIYHPEFIQWVWIVHLVHLSIRNFSFNGSLHSSRLTVI